MTATTALTLPRRRPTRAARVPGWLPVRPTDPPYDDEIPQPEQGGAARPPRAAGGEPARDEPGGPPPGADAGIATPTAVRHVLPQQRAFADLPETFADRSVHDTPRPGSPAPMGTTARGTGVRRTARTTAPPVPGVPARGRGGSTAVRGGSGATRSGSAAARGGSAVVRSGSTGVHQTGPVAGTTRAGTTRAAAGTRADDQPDPRRTAAAVVRLVVEVLSGARPTAHLAAWTTPALQSDLERTVSSLTVRQPGQVRSVRVSEPVAGVAEVSAVVSRGARMSALALRMERTDDRWRMTTLQLG